MTCPSFYMDMWFEYEWKHNIVILHCHYQWKIAPVNEILSENNKRHQDNNSYRLKLRDEVWKWENIRQYGIQYVIKLYVMRVYWKYTRTLYIVTRMTMSLTVFWKTWRIIFWNFKLWDMWFFNILSVIESITRFDIHLYIINN